MSGEGGMRSSALLLTNLPAISYWICFSPFFSSPLQISTFPSHTHTALSQQQLRCHGVWRLQAFKSNSAARARLRLTSKSIYIELSYFEGILFGIPALSRSAL